MIEIADKWTRQPQRTARPDLSNPLARGLVRLWNPAVGFNGWQYDSAPTVAATTRQPSQFGHVYDFAASSSIRSADFAASLTGAPLTLAVYVYSDNSNTGGSMLSVGASDGSDNYIELQWGGNSAPKLRARGSAIGDANGPSGTRFVTALISGSCDSTASRTCYVNGIPGTADTTSVTIAGNNRPLVGALWRGSPSASFSDGASVNRIYMAAIWNRALSPSEHRDLADNPWQVFAKRPKRIYVSAAGGASSLPVFVHQHRQQGIM